MKVGRKTIISFKGGSHMCSSHYVPLGNKAFSYNEDKK